MKRIWWFVIAAAVLLAAVGSAFVFGHRLGENSPAHAYDSPAGKFYFDEQAEQSIIELCRYAQSHKEVKIVTATEGWLAAQPLQ